MRTSLDLCFCLLTLCGITPVLHGVKVVMDEDSDAVLPCLISTKEDISGKIFAWMKDGQKEVFLYDAGNHYNNGRDGQDEQFKGRVSFFQDQLMNGDASIKIHNTKVADSGNYSCFFPRLQSQTFNIELVVGASPKPYVSTLDQTKDWSLLQCEVRGASPEPKVEWQDRAGNILPAEEPQVSERGGRYYVTLKTTVTKTDHYRCVVTQEDISHQIHSETFVQLNEEQSREVEYWWLAAIVLGVLAAVLPLVVAAVCCLCPYSPRRRRIRKRSDKMTSMTAEDQRWELTDRSFRLVKEPSFDDSDYDSTEEKTSKTAELQRFEVTDRSFRLWKTPSFDDPEIIMPDKMTSMTPELQRFEVTDRSDPGEKKTPSISVVDASSH